MMAARLFALLILVTLTIVPARADDLRPGYLALTQKSATAWQVVWKAPIAGGRVTAATPALPRFCSVSAPQRIIENGASVKAYMASCSEPLFGSKIGLVGIDAAFSEALVRIAPLGHPLQAARLTAIEPKTEVTAAPSRTQVAQTYFWLGVEHILAGFDHLLFVLALILLIKGGTRIAGAVTAFTAAHSITLITTALNLISVPRPPVEVCIALSIVFLAVEIVKHQPDAPRLSERRPWLIAFAFGLLHGFGFAGALAEIGLPEGEVPVALLTFNLGVEVGQLIIVACGVAVVALIRHFAMRHLRAAKVASAYLIGSIAAFWMIERALV